MIKATLLAVMALLSVAAHAYVGPGLGLGAIGAIFGVIFAMIMAVLGIFWYPIKRLFKKNKSDDIDVDEQTRNTSDTKDTKDT